MAGAPFSYAIYYPDDRSLRVDEIRIAPKSEAKSDWLAPVVLLIGWSGCHDKHLVKYSPIYAKKGYITVRVIVPKQTLFFQSYKVGSVVKRLLDLLMDKGLASHPVIFHAFSNGGCVTYAQVSKILTTKGSKYYHCLTVCGVIIDSAPGRRGILFGVKAFMATLHTSATIRYLLGVFMAICLFVYCSLLTWIPAEWISLTFNVFDFICEDRMRCPQLFLYSKCDGITLYTDVEEAIKHREKLGVTVKKLCWEDSAHVAHLCKHPEIYTLTCQEFAQSCFTAPLVAQLSA